MYNTCTVYRASSSTKLIQHTLHKPHWHTLYIHVYTVLWHICTYSEELYELNLANLPGYYQLGWTQDWLCIFVYFPEPQHSVLKACESGLYDEDWHNAKEYRQF